MYTCRSRALYESRAPLINCITLFENGKFTSLNLNLQQSTLPTYRTNWILRRHNYKAQLCTQRIKSQFKSYRSWNLVSIEIIYLVDEKSLHKRQLICKPIYFRVRSSTANTKESKRIIARGKRAVVNINVGALFKISVRWQCFQLKKEYVNILIFVFFRLF